MVIGGKVSRSRLAECAITLLPTTADAMDGPMQLENLARVAAQVGEPDRALEILEKLLTTPYESL